MKMLNRNHGRAWLASLALFSFIFGCGPSRSNNDSLTDQENDNYAAHKAELAQVVGTTKDLFTYRPLAKTSL
jgi:hypothetical protein